MLIPTIYGDLKEHLLEKVEGLIDNDRERTTWIEYWLADELVHRSAHVTLKQWPAGLGAVVGKLG